MNGDEYDGERKRYGLSAQSHRWEVQRNYIVYLGGKTRVETSTMCERSGGGDEYDEGRKRGQSRRDDASKAIILGIYCTSTTEMEEGNKNKNSERLGGRIRPVSVVPRVSRVCRRRGSG